MDENVYIFQHPGRESPNSTMDFSFWVCPNMGYPGNWNLRLVRGYPEKKSPHICPDSSNVQWHPTAQPRPREVFEAMEKTGKKDWDWSWPAEHLRISVSLSLDDIPSGYLT